jgi:hypothetical protein
VKYIELIKNSRKKNINGNVGYYLSALLSDFSAGWAMARDKAMIINSTATRENLCKRLQLDGKGQRLTLALQVTPSAGYRRRFAQRQADAG